MLFSCFGFKAWPVKFECVSIKVWTIATAFTACAVSSVEVANANSGPTAAASARASTQRPEGPGRRTWPQTQYQLDIGAMPTLAIESDFDPVEHYEDPNMAEVIHLDSPLLDPRFTAFNVIVIVNKEANNLKRAQTMRVYDRSVGLKWYWKVSTARVGATTHDGYFIPQYFSSGHVSSIYGEPMPWSVFFDGNRATHGIRKSNYHLLGSRASAGCVRLESQRARALFHTVGHSGVGLVPLFSKQGEVLRLADGSPRLVQSYKTLIIVKSTPNY